MSRTAVIGKLAAGSNLPPDVTAADGARSIHLALVKGLRADEPGLRANLDTEFLHDFRVGVRRTRSLLGQIRDVFPPDALAHFSSEFSWLGSLTGPPRDLDVLALSLRTPREDLSVDELSVVKALLGDIQQRAHRHLADALDSERYRQLLGETGAFDLTAIEEEYTATGGANGMLCVVVMLPGDEARHEPRRQTERPRTGAEQMREIARPHRLHTQ